MVIKRSSIVAVLASISMASLLSACSDESDPALLSALAANEYQLVEPIVQENFTITDSGLQYEILKAADGSKPTVNSTITVHYLGQLTDGTEFDSSYSRGEPSTFPLGGTIDGWREGIPLMSVGSQYRFVIPGDLAYGATGNPPLIGPYETLIFTVELLEINSN